MMGGIGESNAVLDIFLEYILAQIIQDRIHGPQLAMAMDDRDRITLNGESRERRQGTREQSHRLRSPGHHDCNNYTLPSDTTGAPRPVSTGLLFK